MSSPRTTTHPRPAPAAEPQQRVGYIRTIISTLPNGKPRPGWEKAHQRDAIARSASAESAATVVIDFQAAEDVPMVRTKASRGRPRVPIAGAPGPIIGDAGNPPPSASAIKGTGCQTVSDVSSEQTTVDPIIPTTARTIPKAANTVSSSQTLIDATLSPTDPVPHISARPPPGRKISNEHTIYTPAYAFGFKLPKAHLIPEYEGLEYFPDSRCPRRIYAGLPIPGAARLICPTLHPSLHGKPEAEADSNSATSSVPSTPIITPPSSYAVEGFNTTSSAIIVCGVQLPHARRLDGNQGLLYDPKSRFHKRVYLTLPEPGARRITIPPRPAPLPEGMPVPAPFPPLGTPKDPLRSAMKGRPGSRGSFSPPRSIRWPAGRETYTPPLDSYDLREIVAEPYDQEPFEEEAYVRGDPRIPYCYVAKAQSTCGTTKHHVVGRTCA